jgi:hypothetical protein
MTCYYISSCDALQNWWWSVEHPVAAERHQLLPRESPSPKHVVAAEAETSSSAYKKGKLFCAFAAITPTSALKPIKATGNFLDVCMMDIWRPRNWTRGEH